MKTQSSPFMSIIITCNVNSRVFEESSWRAGSQGRGFRGGRGNYSSPYISHGIPNFTLKLQIAPFIEQVIPNKENDQASYYLDNRTMEIGKQLGDQLSIALAHATPVDEKLPHPNKIECNIEEVSDEEDPPSKSSKDKKANGPDSRKAPSLVFKITSKVPYKTVLKAHSALFLKAESMADKVEWLNKLGNVIQPSKGGQLKGDAAFSMRESLSDGSLDTMARRPADPEEELRWMAQEVRGYVEAVLNSLAANVPKAVVLCQVEKAKEDMLNKLYSSIRAATKGHDITLSSRNQREQQKPTGFFSLLLLSTFLLAAEMPQHFCFFFVSCFSSMLLSTFLLLHRLLLRVALCHCFHLTVMGLLAAVFASVGSGSCSIMCWFSVAGDVVSFWVEVWLSWSSLLLSMILLLRPLLLCVGGQVFSHGICCLELIGAGFDALCCCICSYAVWYCFGLIVAVLCGRFGFPIVV
ncbi:dynamin GTPase [Sarracenia purpurea var. burkii]